MDTLQNAADNNPIMVVVNIQSEHTSQAELYTITLSLVDNTREESGCLEYNCYCNIDDDSVMEMILFKNTAAHKAHMNSPHVLAFQEKYQPLNLQYRVQRVNYTS
ncbi:putative quinol monooxygenase [Shewanella sp. 10N.286.54.B9]|uniref:putative quinol monooxygenase n=1 Tax=Shewanella sp. 10N.286.54.B9 TaxID=3229719 RepID=UPI003551EEBD